MHTVIRHAIQDDGFTVVVSEAFVPSENASFQYYTTSKTEGDHYTTMVVEERYPTEMEAIEAFDAFQAATNALRQET
jgi:hypothetical protein